MNNCVVVFFMDEYVRGVMVKVLLSEEQKEIFNQNFGCCRKAHNEVLSRYKEMHEDKFTKIPSRSELNKILNEVKKEFPYLRDVESTSLQQAVFTIQDAVENYFKSRRHNPPIFHSKKKSRLSFTQTIRKDKRPVNGNILTLRVYGDMEIRTSPEYFALLNNPELKFNFITISFDGLDYYASFNVEGGIRPEQLPLTGKHIGCDINSNVNGWLVTSDEQKEYFDVYHESQMIKHVNQLMAKCRQKSRRWKKLNKRLQKWYNKRTNKLNDYIEKLTYNLVKKYEAIVFEKNYATIKILIGGEQNMIFPLSRFIRRLKDKFKLYKPTADGVQFVDPKYTSRTCRHCGYVHEELEVKTRKFRCKECNKLLDRDINAAINILNRWFNGDSPENT